MRTKIGAAAAALVVALTLSACAGLSAFGEEISRAFKGVPATFTTYDQRGQLIDEVHGVSFRVSRDDRFDTSNSDGSSNNDSQVLLVSVGNDHISHVGSSMILAQDGLVKVGDTGTLKTDSYEPGVPFINDFRERFQNLWQGRSKTIMLRSQDGLPIAVYAGNSVEVFATDVPKSTWFRVDGKYLLAYRVDYTVYDNSLLDR